MYSAYCDRKESNEWIDMMCGLLRQYFLLQTSPHVRLFDLLQLRTRTRPLLLLSIRTLLAFACTTQVRTQTYANTKQTLKVPQTRHYMHLCTKMHGYIHLFHTHSETQITHRTSHRTNTQRKRPPRTRGLCTR